MLYVRQKEVIKEFVSWNKRGFATTVSFLYRQTMTCRMQDQVCTKGQGARKVLDSRRRQVTCLLKDALQAKALIGWRIRFETCINKR